MEGDGNYIAGAARTSVGSRAPGTLLAFSRAEHPPLCRCPGVRGRTWLDGHHVVAATGRHPCPGGALRNPCRLFLVLLLARNRFAKSGFRLRTLPGQPYLVRGTRLPGEAFSPALRTMGLLSAGDCRSLLLPCLSFRQSPG